MYTLLTKAKIFLEAAINAGQRKVLGALRKLSQALESPQDSAQRIMYLVRIFLIRQICPANTPLANPDCISSDRLRSEAL